MDQVVERSNLVGHEGHRLGSHGFQRVQDVVAHNWVRDDLTELSFQLIECPFSMGWFHEPAKKKRFYGYIYN